MRLLALLVFVVACGSKPPPRVELPATKPAIVEVPKHFDPTATYDVSSTDVTYHVEGHDVPATIVHPKPAGTYPAIVLVAGSGPTDRDWNSALLPGKNGSGKLLAEALAAHGAVVLRFDKAGVGANKAALDTLTLDTYVDEIRGGLNLLRGRGDVDQGHMYVAGHSEGGVHAIRASLAEGGRIAGVILLSSAGRPIRDIILGQLAAQFATAVRLGPDKGGMAEDMAKAQLDSVRQALDAFIEGRPVDPMAVSPVPAIQGLIASIADPKVAKLSRDLLAYDPAEGAKKLKVPVFIFNGLKDVQVDPQLDASRLEKLVRDNGGDVTLFLAPDANHVLKHEPKSTVELRANLVATQTAYNAPDTKLDATTISAISNWLSQHTK